VTSNKSFKPTRNKPGLNRRSSVVGRLTSGGCFRVFSETRTVNRSFRDTGRLFMLSCYRTENDPTPEAFFAKCHDIISHFLLAINIATLGHFTWDFQFVSPTPYLLVDERNKNSHFIFGQFGKYQNKEKQLDITKGLIWRTLQVFLAIASENERSLKKEYIKGLYNLHHSFFDIEFLNEAFSNFYKAFEFFCTTRLLKVKKLTNEKKQLRQVLSDFGFEEEVLTDFDKIYQIRCNQVMHAQKNLESIDQEAVIRIKIFLDSIMHNFYKPVWERLLKR